MDKAILIGICAILVTVITGFATTMLKLGQIDQKIEVLWDWYVEEMQAGRRRNRRHGDLETADDREE